MTRARDQYDLARRNQANLRRVNELLSAEASTVLGRGSNLGQQDMGGFLRTVVPGLIDRYGNVNATVAVKYYEEQRLAWLTSRPAGFTTRQARQNQSRRADRVARARTQGQIFVARLPRFDAIAKSETVVNYGMALLQKTGFESMTAEVTNAMTRAVAGYNRDTLLYNSALDDAVIGVQRVAEPGACDFCQTVAFDSYGGVRVTDYAVAWHNNCNCSLETLYAGDAPFRPDYYDDFEYGSTDAEASVSSDWDSFKKEFAGDYVSQ